VDGIARADSFVRTNSNNDRTGVQAVARGGGLSTAGQSVKNPKKSVWP
jgi:hypothetical protein